MDFTDERYFEIKKFAEKISDEDFKRRPCIENNYELPKLSSKNLPTIKEFYKNQNVFITGGNGFMGKVLIEKLLRSCPDINKIYLLLRQKKGISPEKRLNDLLENSVFDRLKNENRNGLSKLVIIHGDCEKPNLGMSYEDIQLLKEDVNIIFHAAASVRLDNPLKQAVLMNVRSARDLISLAKEMKHLKVFVHLSTAYCNVDKQIIHEKVYPQQANWKHLIQMAETFDNETIKLLTAKILNGLPNTYTFTKSLAENVINDECGNIPTVIYRPSIVISTEKEPVPGWLENLNGPFSFYLGFTTGLVHVFCLDENVAADYIPVDHAIINMIIASWYQANNSVDNIKKSVLKMCRKAYVSNMALKPFMTNEWLFINGNYLSLCNVLKDEDKEDFYADARKVNKFSNVSYGLYGLKKYILKENVDDNDTLLKARALYKKFHMAHRMVIFVFCVCVFYLFCKTLPILRVINF